jgi:hypothetical protein
MTAPFIHEYLKMTFSNQSKATAVILSAELALKQANLAHQGIITDTAKLLLSTAHDHQTSVDNAYSILCEEYKQLEAQQEQRKIKAVEAYDSHIAKNQGELKQINQDIERLTTEVSSLEKDLQRKKETHGQQEVRLKAEGLTKDQIKTVLGMGESLDESKILEEIKYKNEIKILLNERADEIYTEARSIKETVIYTQ